MQTVYFIINLPFKKHPHKWTIFKLRFKVCLNKYLLFSKVKNYTLSAYKNQISSFCPCLFQEAYYNLIPIFCHSPYLLKNVYAYYQKIMRWHLSVFNSAKLLYNQYTGNVKSCSKRIKNSSSLMSQA